MVKIEVCGRTTSNGAFLGVRALPTVGPSAFSGLLWLEDDAARERGVRALSELARMRCDLLGSSETRVAPQWNVQSYISALKEYFVAPTFSSMLLKVSLEETLPLATAHPNIALDLRGRSDLYDEACRIATERPGVAWIEEPGIDPADIGTADLPNCSLVFGEHCSTYEGVQTLLESVGHLPNVIVQLEPSRLGASETLRAGRLVVAFGRELAFHGHLPLDCIALAGLLTSKPIRLEWNLPYLAERTPHLFGADEAIQRLPEILRRLSNARAWRTRLWYNDLDAGDPHDWAED